MKLTIQNLDKYNNYADVWFPANGNVTPVGVEELAMKYVFKYKRYEFEFEIHLLRNTDFMPGWPVEVWAFNYMLGRWVKLSESNARENQITSKAEWCFYVKDLIEWASSNNHKNLR